MIGRRPMTFIYRFIMTDVLDRMRTEALELQYTEQAPHADTGALEYLRAQIFQQKIVIERMR